jgi:hypothetical protein
MCSRSAARPKCSSSATTTKSVTHGMHQRVKPVELGGALRRGGKLGERRIRHRQRRRTQEEDRRQRFRGAAHDAVGRLRLDLALDKHGGAVMRVVDGMGMGEIAEAIHEGRQRPPPLAAHAPAYYAETLMRPRREAQRLDRIMDRAGVVIRGLVANLQSHCRYAKDLSECSWRFSILVLEGAFHHGDTEDTETDALVMRRSDEARPSA